MRKTIATIFLLSLTLSLSANAKPLDGNGNVVSHKTGARATVSPQHAAAFQAYIDDLEAGGAKIYFMGGTRRGHCSSRHMHPCGKALDVCQLGRGRVDRRCNLPDRHYIASIAARHGLFEGGQWCHHDYGHAQVGVTAAACGTTLTARRKHERSIGSGPVLNGDMFNIGDSATRTASKF